MAFRMNPVTNKWEQVPAQGKGQPTPSPATAKTPTVNIGQARTTTANLPQATRVAATARPQRIAPSVTPRPTGSTTPKPPASDVGPQPSEIGSVPIMPQQMDSQQAVINAMWQSVYDEAANYKQINFGEDPPAGWWAARTAPIEAAQKRLDASGKSKGDGGASDRAKAAQAEAERIRNVKGGREAEEFLREQAKIRKAEMLKKVAELYDPQKTKSAEDLKTVLQSASDAFDLAEQQVTQGQDYFAKNFKGSTAYEGVPVSTFNVADNPLLAALQSQGAGTGEVQAATDLARQTAQSTSDLEKWAMSQLNTGQQNYGSAIQNAAQMGTMAALQQLGGRRANVKTGIEQQFADALAAISAAQTGAEGNVEETIAELIAEADKIRADTTAKYGDLPKDKIDKTLPVVKKPVAGTSPKAPAAPKKPPVKKTPQQVEAERLAAMAKQYRK
jgi:hypothetical protein